VTESSVLFDTRGGLTWRWPAPKPLLCMEEPAQSASGTTARTAIDPAGSPMSVATDWRDLEAYCDLLVQTLTGAPAAASPVYRPAYSIGL